MATAGDHLRAIAYEHQADRGERLDELQVMQWVDNYKRTCGRPFPTIGEVLAVVLLLGYRQTGKNRLDAPHDLLDVAEQGQFLERLAKRCRHPRFALRGRPEQAKKKARAGQPALSVIMPNSSQLSWQVW